MGLKAVANPAAGGQPGSFTTLTVTGAATIGGGLAVTGQVGASAFATTGYDASAYSTKLLLAGSSTADNFATFIASNGAGRTYYMGPGVGDGALTTFALYDNTSGATRWRSTATGFDVTGSISATDNATFKTVSATGQISAVADGSIVMDMNGVDTGRILSANSGGTFTTPISVVNPMSFTSFLQGAEETAPTAPTANGYRIFAQDNGAGKTQLMVIFGSGAAQQIAIEP